MDRKSLYPWLALNGIAGLGKVGFARLIERYGSPIYIKRGPLFRMADP